MHTIVRLCSVVKFYIAQYIKLFFLSFVANVKCKRDNMDIQFRIKIPVLSIYEGKTQTLNTKLVKILYLEKPENFFTILI